MSAIDKATGLSTTEWETGRDVEGRLQATLKADREYVVTSLQEGGWSLAEAGVSVGIYASAVAAAAEVPSIEYDFWDDVDGTGDYLFLRLAPTDFHEWVSDERETVYLRKEDGAWWLSEPGRSGQSKYPTCLRGKIAGLEVREDSFIASDRKVMASLNLDESEWKIEMDSDLIVATSLRDGSMTLQADSSSSEWGLFDGEELVGYHRTVEEAAFTASTRSLTA